MLVGLLSNVGAWNERTRDYGGGRGGEQVEAAPDLVDALERVVDDGPAPGWALTRVSVVSRTPSLT